MCIRDRGSGKKLCKRKAGLRKGKVSAGHTGSPLDVYKRQGLESLAAQCENLIVVSNEVFSGGADDLARAIAAVCGAVPVITTATDARCV